MTVRAIVLTMLLVAGSLAPIVSTLFARVPHVIDVPMAPWRSGRSARAVALLETAGPAPPVYVLWLRIDDLPSFVKHPEIRILFSTYRTRAHLQGATLQVLGSECAYSTPEAAVLLNDELLSFIRQPGCTTSGASSTDLKLTVRLSERARVGVWTFTAPAEPVAQTLVHVIGLPGQGGPYPVLRGRYVTYGQDSGQRRIDLLNYVWQVGVSSGWILWTLALSACLALGGALTLLHRQSPAATAVAMFFLATSIGVLYAVLVPPFHAPDEPDHFLSYGRLANKPWLEGEAEEWARIGHLERIRFQREERFRPADVGNPFPVAWQHHEVFADDVRARSLTTAVWWDVLSRFSRQTRVPQQLLFLRIANVLLFALCVAAVAALLVGISGREVSHAEMLAVVFLLIPSLPFFAMHVSESSVLTSVYVLVAVCALVMFISGSRASWIGAPLGLSIAVALASGRSVLPMAPLMFALLCIRVVLGEQSRDPDIARRGRLVFWAGLGLGLSASAWLFVPDYASSASDPIPGVAEHTVLPWLRAVWRPSILATMAAAGWLLELAVTRSRRLIPPSAEHGFGTAVRWSAFALAGTVFCSLVWSLFAEFPQLEYLETDSHPSQGKYVLDVLRVAAYWARAKGPDLLLSSSFWAGFGWVDAIPSVALVNGMTIGTALLLAGLLIGIGCRRDIRRFASLMFLGTGIATAIGAYALATHGMQRNLHGRYLIGVYLTGLAIAFSPLSMAAPRFLRTRRTTWAAIVLCAIAAIHAYCLSSLLQRYF